MKIIVNDKPIKITEGVSLKELLDVQNINAQGIATAVNGDVISAVNRANTILHENDVIVIIKAFYGG